MTEAKIDKKVDVIKEKVRKTTSLSKKTLAHLETLKHYYRVNMEKRMITIPIHYASTSEIVDESMGSKKYPMIKRELLAKFSDLIHTIPYEFKINIDLKIDDYQGYNHNDLAKSIMDAFELFQYDSNKKKTISYLKVAALIIVGVVVFAWLFYLHSKNIWGEGQEADPTHNTVHELIYTIAGVVLWEAVYVIFLPENNYQDISFAILHRINCINLINKDNKLLKMIGGSTMYKYRRVETKKEIRARKFLLICGTTLLAVAGCKLIDIIEVFIKYPNQWVSVLIAVLIIVEVLFVVLAGIGAISYYRDKGPFKKWILPFGIISIIVCLAEIISISALWGTIGTSGIKILVLACFIMAISIAYICCVVMLNKKAKQKINNKSSFTKK